MSANKSTELHRDPATLRGTRLRVEDPPEWIVRRTVKNAPRNPDHPIALLLLDRQIHADRLMRYTRIVRRLETPQAVQEAGRIELDFDPATQTLLIHSISIFRDGTLTNVANLDDIEIIQRERDLENGIYAGSITALILLKDVRTGDIIDIETSIHSDDAIFKGHYWIQENFEHILPVTAQYFSWTANDLSRFQIRSTADELAEIDEEDTDFGRRRTWHRFKGPANDLEPALPPGYNPFRHIALTSFQTWRDVAAEVADLWSAAADPGDDLLAELKTLQASVEPGSVALIERLAAFVRDTIRYQGVEVGHLGLIPEALNVIWERRFGDCKEKTNLLCWLLRQCGFEATPALVSVGLLGRITDQLPAPLFDHVVVHLRHDEHDFWIDPTNISQRGRLDDWTSLPFEKALLISPDTGDFLDIPPPSSADDILRVDEHYQFSGANTASISVVHEYRGSSADQVRHVLEAQGRVAVQQVFTDIVKSTRSSAEISEDMTVEDDPDENRLILSAKFEAPEIFAKGGAGQAWFCEFVPHSIVGKIVGVDHKARTHPLGLLHPVNVEHTTRINHPEAKGSVVPKTIINNEFMEFEAGTRSVGKVPALFYKFQTKAPEVPPKAIGRYRTNLDQIGQVISLVFNTQRVDGKRGPTARATGNWMDEETDPRGPAQRAYREPRSGSSVPVWLIVIGVIILLRIIAAVITAN